MTTLFDSRLSDRDFSSHLLYVPDLLGWTKLKRLHLRATPSIEGYEFVQVEALLCAIERHAGDLTTEQALEIVASDPVLNIERTAKDPTTARWLLGAEAHRKWRVLLIEAIATHELTLLDFGSKLPINTAPLQNTETPATVDSVGALAAPTNAGPAALNTRAMANCFAGLHWGCEHWIKKLGDKPVWLAECLVLNRGRGEGMRQWNPVLIGAYLVRKDHVEVKSVRAKFQTKTALKPWLDAWNTYAEEQFPTR